MSEQENVQTENAGSHRFNALLRHTANNKIDVALWASRCSTLIFTLLYFFPIVGQPHSSYNKALLSNGVTSALRLHQRCPDFRFSREYLEKLLMEDSCHYLLFSLVFLQVQPTSLVLLPIFLFALLHFSSYALKMLDILGRNSWWVARFLVSIVEVQSTNILMMVAFTEIFLVVIVLTLVFSGGCSFFTPLMYYNFVTLRYRSQRNPYCRSMFRELRLGLEQLARHPSCPAFVGSLVHQVISLLLKLAPLVPQQ